MRVYHPIVGTMDLTYVAMRPTDDADQTLITYSAPPSTPAAASLRVLASWYADSHDRHSDRDFDRGPSIV